MKVRALRGFCTGAGRNVAVGDVFEATEWQAREWSFIGHAEVVKEEAETPPPPPAAEKAEEPKEKPEGEKSEGETGEQHPEQKADKVEHREPGRRTR